jgi:hypothetical protein
MISLKKINKEKVKPVKVDKIDDKNVKGLCVLPLYSNTFIVAKKNSGKTVLINHILSKCSNRNSKIYFFVSTIYKDATYKSILEMLDKKKIEYEIYLNIVENGINHLEEIINNLSIEDDFSSSSSDDDMIIEKKRYINCGSDEEEDEEEIKKYKPKMICAEQIFIFDDLSDQLRNKYLSVVLKKNRHFKSKTIISSQYLHDVKPEVLMNLDVCIIFGGMPEEKLKIIYKNLDIGLIDFETFKNIYEEATNKKYDFLKINIRDETFFKNFNKQFLIS